MKMVYAVFLTALLGFSGTVLAQEMVDGVVAIVGYEAILLSDLQQQMQGAMMDRGLSADSPRDQLTGLRQEVIEGMVEDLLLLDEAKRDSTITIDQQEVDNRLGTAMEELRQQFGGEDGYTKALAEYGFTDIQMRMRHRRMIQKNILKETFLGRMQRHISVTPQEMEQWIQAHADSIPEIPEQYKVSHILLYPNVAGGRREETKQKLASILARARAGEDFAELARQYSEDPGNAAEGGDLGYFDRNVGFVKEFTDAAFALDEGETSEIVETPFGYHIIKCDDILGDRIHARHILLRLTPDVRDDDEIVQRLNGIREKILAGEATFEDMAKEYSQDENSSSLGGQLDWLNEGAALTSFITAAATLEKGGISEPFKSEYGWHIIRLDDKKQAHKLNIRDDRTILENVIGQRKLIDEYNRVIQGLREKTYIDVRLN